MKWKSKSKSDGNHKGKKHARLKHLKKNPEHFWNKSMNSSMGTLLTSAEDVLKRWIKNSILTLGNLEQLQLKQNPTTWIFYAT